MLVTSQNGFSFTVFVAKYTVPHTEIASSTLTYALEQDGTIRHPLINEDV